MTSPFYWLKNRWADLKESFWALPSALMLGAVGAALLFPFIDREYFDQTSREAYYLFGGGPEAARVLLSAIASALTTVVSVSFSITIVALQQASVQYSPRILSNFTQDRTNQFVLGTYIATVTYSLLVLRDVRGKLQDHDAFVPALSITVALALAILSLALLIFFLHHISKNLRVSSILNLIRRDLDHELRRAYPGKIQRGELLPESYAAAELRSQNFRNGICSEVRVRSEGYLRNVDLDALVDITKEQAIRFVWLMRYPGEYLVQGSVLLKVWADREMDSRLESKLLDSVVLRPDRSTAQDALFGIRQIRDIALKALSPGINDPSTAEECLHHLKGALAILLDRKFPVALEEKHGTWYLIRRADLDDFFEASFVDIARASESNPRVLETLRGVIAELGVLEPARMTDVLVAKCLRRIESVTDSVKTQAAQGTA